MEPIIKIHNMHKHFGRTHAVNGLSLDVPEGCVMAFLGPNGAGKTTTIKTMLNMYTPNKGEVQIMGKDSRKLDPETFQRIGYVSENQQLPTWMTVEQFMHYCRPMYPQWDHDFSDKLLKNFELPLNRKLKHLSRGMKMKAALLCSLAYRPKLVVLDEPFSGLDPLVRDEFLRGLLELTEQEGWTVFISSHDIDEVERLCDAIAVIDQGGLQLNEPVDSLQRRFRKVDVTCKEEIKAFDKPDSWHHPEVSGRSISVIVSDFESEEASRKQLDELLPPVHNAAFHGLSLREIFIALARTFRLQHKNGKETAA